MHLQFESQEQIMTFLDPNLNWQRRSQLTELRKDPVTGYQTRVLHFPVHKPQRPDVTGLVEKSIKYGCPFCPESVYKLTPQFPEEINPAGRFQVGEALVFPNMFPYDTHSGVAIFSKEHYVPLDGFTEDTLASGFIAAQKYLQAVMLRDPESCYCSINWNYMPVAGASMVHPHIQIVASSTPTTYQQALLEASSRYYREHRLNIWEDLVNSEKQQDQRYVGNTGNIEWLCAFAPKGYIDVIGLFRGQPSIIDISVEDWRDFASGLRRALLYYHSRNFGSFNLSVFSGIRQAGDFWVQARIVPRLHLTVLGTSDINYFHMLHGEYLTVVQPEEAAQEMKKFFLEEI
ncbi:MAG: hypothetical protein ACYCX4_04465 [Bacillota bacterium]